MKRNRRPDHARRRAPTPKVNAPRRTGHRLYQTHLDDLAVLLKVGPQGRPVVMLDHPDELTALGWVERFGDPRRYLNERCRLTREGLRITRGLFDQED